MNKKVSIIVPVYKVEQYLRHCLDSILKQTYQELEIILVDDGSPDNCGVICDEYAAKDSRIKVIHQVNGGLSSARNSGLDVATGEYIAFVDSDDWITTNAIERAIATYEETGADLVVFNVEPVFTEKVIHGQYLVSPITDEMLTPKQLINKLCQCNGWYYCVAWNKLYRRSVFDTLRFPVGYLHEDEAVFHHIIVQCNKIATVDDVLYMYRQSENSIMNSGLSVKRTDALSAMADRLLCSRKHKWSEYEKSLVVLYESKFWEWYHLFSGDKENEKYIKRMENSLKKALPSVLRSGDISVSHKIYLTLLRFSPKLFWAVYRSVRLIKT